MRKNGLSARRPSLFGRDFSAVALLGIAAFVATPSPIAMQDVAGMISGLNRSEFGVGAVLEKSPAGAIQKAELAFADTSLITGSIPAAGIRSPGLGEVLVNGKAGTPEETPDEDRVNRGDKKGRLVKVVKTAPPKAFSAGSVFQRSSSLLRPSIEPGVEMAFAKPKIKGEEIRIAKAFYEKKSKPVAAQVPVYLADLVTNDRPDSLAVAYAPAKPDFARQSPFAALLREEPAKPARFIPPMMKGDHDWVASPLPAHVFSAKEQECLARGVYFEARGEPVKGQAAVAQVILNRVRNPQFPNTICGVVYQNDHWRNRCQFSFACDGIRDKIADHKRYLVAVEVSKAVTAGKIYLPEVASSTHYHATYVNPRWARTMEKMNKIGLHIFYRTYGGGWS